jgi:hypothetical protein
MDEANEGLASVEEAFEQLSLRVGGALIAKWEQEERTALAPEGIGRKIYNAETADGMRTNLSHKIILIPVAAPEVTEMCLRLTEAEKKAKGKLSGSIALITEGLNIQQTQFVNNCMA